MGSDIAVLHTPGIDAIPGNEALVTEGCEICSWYSLGELEDRMTVHVMSMFRFCCMAYLIIINVTHIFVVRDNLFNSGRNVTKPGRITKGRAVSNLAEPKFGLRSLRPNSCHFYGRRCI